MSVQVSAEGIAVMERVQLSLTGGGRPQGGAAVPVTFLHRLKQAEGGIRVP